MLQCSCCCCCSILHDTFRQDPCDRSVLIYSITASSFQIHNAVFLEAGVNRGVQTKLYKLIHLNDVQYNLKNVYAEKFGLSGFPAITRIWRNAADRFQFYDTVNDPLEQRNLISTNDEDLQDKRDELLRM